MDARRGRVVVGFDGSGLAGAAVEWAAVHAQCRGVPLMVVYVLDQVADVVTSRLLHVPVMQRMASGLAREGVERAGKASPGLDAEGVVRVGRPAAALVDCAHGAALMVLGTRGYTGVVGALLGSVTAAVTAHASCPVVVIDDIHPTPLDREHPVLVGVDGSLGSQSALEFGVEAAAAAGVPLTIVTAFLTDAADPNLRDRLLSLERGGGPVFNTAARVAAREALDAAVALAFGLNPGLDIRTRVVEAPAVDTLARAAAGHGLLVLGARGGGGFGGSGVGSVTRALLQDAPCPVAVVPVKLEARPTGAMSPPS